MTTPTRNDIRDKAIEMFNEKNQHLPTLTPTDSELRESGYWKLSRDSLMRNEAKHAQLSYIEEMALEMGYRLIPETQFNGENKKKMLVDRPTQISLKSILKTGLAVIASKGHGKTTTVKTICQRFKNEMPDVSIKVIDTALNWSFNSSLDSYQIIQLGKPIVNRKNCVFDCSLLKHPQLVTDFTRKLMMKDLEANIRLKLRQFGHIDKPVLYVLEETQGILSSSSLRRDINKPILKFVSEGRNFGELSYIIISQRPQSLSTEMVERCEGYLFGKLLGDRNLTKVRRIAGKKIAKRIKSLKVGEYIYFTGDKSELVKFKEFKLNSKPQRIS